MLLINYNKTLTDRCSSVDDIYIRKSVIGGIYQCSNKTQNKGFFI